VSITNQGVDALKAEIETVKQNIDERIVNAIETAKGELKLQCKKN
jgi:hypothetical protein